jgi:hypothetical protein
MEASLLLQVPPVVASVNVVEAAAHNVVVPDIAATVAPVPTVIAAVALAVPQLVVDV